MTPAAIPATPDNILKVDTCVVFTAGTKIVDQANPLLFPT
jgi:hypothetical protein